MRPTAFAFLALLSVSACATGSDRYGYSGRDWNWHDGLYELDPWLEDTEEGREIVHRDLGRGPWDPEEIRALNMRFRRYADMDRDMRLTDAEIRYTLVRCANLGWG